MNSHCCTEYSAHNPHRANITIVRFLCVYFKQFNGGRSNVLYFMRNIYCWFAGMQKNQTGSSWNIEHILVFRLVLAFQICISNWKFLQIKQWENQLTTCYCQSNALFANILTLLLHISSLYKIAKQCSKRLTVHQSTIFKQFEN